MPSAPPLLARSARIAVIGAGAAGLVAARTLRDAGYAVTVFEAAAAVGGTWRADAASSMYDSLRCNLPKQIMAFRGLPFGPEVPSFAPHVDVLAYLERYARVYRLHACFRFGVRVLSVEARLGGEGGWVVHSAADDAAERVEHYGAVVIANGHYSLPNAWRPHGADEFVRSGLRTVSHSHTYKAPKPYVGRKVIVVGAGPSGTDIALELSQSGAATVTLAHRNGAEKEDFGGVVPQSSSVDRLCADGTVVLQDGSTIQDVEDVLLCTGYRYHFPFLDSSSGVTVSDNGRTVHGLIQHCVSLANPTLCFLGLVWKVIPFPLFQDQATFFTSVLTGATTTADLQALHATELKHRATLNIPPRYRHLLGDAQWEYRRTLTGQGTPPALLELCTDASAARASDPNSYRQREYMVLGDGPGEWRVTLDGVDVTGRDDPAVLSSR